MSYNTYVFSYSMKELIIIIRLKRCNFTCNLLYTKDFLTSLMNVGIIACGKVKNLVCWATFDLCIF